MIQKKKPRFGFDLDGVIVDKPPLIPKKLLEWLFKGGKRGLNYRFPKSRFEQIIRKLSHFYLFRPPIKKNIILIRKIHQQKKHDFYLVSSRYSFLQKKTQFWLKKRKINDLFKEIHLNFKNKPPHLFKEKTIRELELDYFFEDDAEVANYLKKSFKKTKVFRVHKKDNRLLRKLVPTRKARILFLLTYYHPHWTGLTAYAQRLAQGLAQRDHQVSVLTLKHQKDLKTKDSFKEVKIIRLKPLARISRSLFAPQLLPILWRLLKKVDVLSVYLPFAEALPAAFLAKLAGKKVFLTHNGDLVLPKGFFNRILEVFYYQSTRWAVYLSNGIVTQTKDYSKRSPLLSRAGQKLKIIYAPVEIPVPKPAAVERWKKSLGIKKKKIIGFSGRFVEEKGFDYLLRAIPLVLKRIPRAIFIYAGEHQIAYEDFYQQCLPLLKKYREKIIFTGLILDRQKMANFYGLLDVFILPSRTDCFPSSQIEAMMCGVPVVATDIPGAREAVRKSGMGLLVKPRSLQALAEGIIKVLKNQKNYLIPRREIEKLFDLEKTVDQYEELFIN